MTSSSSLWVQRYEYFDHHFDFITLFVGILLFYAINYNDVCLLADSLFSFLTMLNLCLIMMYTTNLNEVLNMFFSL